MEFLLGLGAGRWLDMVAASILRTSKDDEQVTWPAKYSHLGPYETAESAMGDGTGGVVPFAVAAGEEHVKRATAERVDPVTLQFILDAFIPRSFL